MTVFAPEPAVQAPPPRTMREAVWEPFTSFFRRPRALEIVAFLLLYKLADNLAAVQWTMTAEEQQRLDDASAMPFPYPHWYQRQFTAERYSRDGSPAEAFTYQFPTTQSPTTQ